MPSQHGKLSALLACLVVSRLGCTHDLRDGEGSGGNDLGLAWVCWYFGILCLDFATKHDSAQCYFAFFCIKKRGRQDDLR